MGQIRVAGFALSLDGFGAGPDQSLGQPLGVRGPELMGWFFPTKTFRAMIGEKGGSDGVDESFANRAMDGFGAFILGRNMFGPIRDDWPDEDWKGWWGDNPPFRAPTFILTHHPRQSIVMEGAPFSTSLPKAFRRPSTRLGRWREARTLRSAGASPRSVNTWRPV